MIFFIPRTPGFSWGPFRRGYLGHLKERLGALVSKLWTVYFTNSFVKLLEQRGQAPWFFLVRWCQGGCHGCFYFILRGVLPILVPPQKGIKVSNSNSKEEQIRVVHHWWATSHESPLVRSGFAAWNFVLKILMFCARELSAVICLRVRPWPRRLSRTPLWGTWICPITASALKPMRPGVSGGPRSPKALLAEYFTNRPQRDIAGPQQHVM